MSLADLLNQTITIYTRSSYNEEGREVVGSGTTYLARVEHKNKSRLLPNGQVISIDAVVYLDGEVSVSINDRIDYGSTKYKIHAKSFGVSGHGGVHHTRLEIMKWKETS